MKKEIWEIWLENQKRGEIDFKIALSLDYASSNWAAIEGFMLKQIHKKKMKSFGSVNFLSKKALEIYSS